MLRTLARHAALALPPLRRFYDHAQSLRGERDRLAADHAGLQAAASRAETERDALLQEVDTLARDLEAARAAAQAASDEREEIELRLYVLQSDFQRSVSAAEVTRARLRSAEAELDALRSAHSALAGPDGSATAGRSGQEGASPEPRRPPDRAALTQPSGTV